MAEWFIAVGCNSIPLGGHRFESYSSQYLFFLHMVLIQNFLLGVLFYFIIFYLYLEEYIYIILKPFFKLLLIRNFSVNMVSELLEIQLIVLFCNILYILCILGCLNLYYWLKKVLFEIELDVIQKYIICFVITYFIFIFNVFLSLKYLLLYFLSVSFNNHRGLFYYIIDLKLKEYIFSILMLLFLIFVLSLIFVTFLFFFYYIDSSYLGRLRLFWVCIIFLFVAFILPADFLLHLYVVFTLLIMYEFGMFCFSYLAAYVERVA